MKSLADELTLRERLVLRILLTIIIHLNVGDAGFHNEIRHIRDNLIKQTTALLPEEEL